MYVVSIEFAALHKFVASIVFAKKGDMRLPRENNNDKPKTLD